MKKNLFILFLLLLSVFINMNVKAQPYVVSNTVYDVSYEPSGFLFDKYEISFRLSYPYIDPYDPMDIDVYAIFTNTNTHHSIRVNAFYYEGYHFYESDHIRDILYHKIEKYEKNNINDWRIRFTPTELGEWTFVIYAYSSLKQENGFENEFPQEQKMYYFQCLPPKHANGFITKANNRFLQRQVFDRNNKNQNIYNESFFPVGPNYAYYFRNYIDTIRSLPEYTYGIYNSFGWPQYSGIYEYKDVIDNKLAENANYCRVWINQYETLSLQGPSDWKKKKSPTVYFEPQDKNKMNQRCSGELDSIIEYARKKDINIMLCLFSANQFNEQYEYWAPNCWKTTPYSQFDTTNIMSFFKNSNSKRYEKNLLRYIVARWGYAPNIMCWELFNEVDQLSIIKKIEDDNALDSVEKQYRIGLIAGEISSWHDDMIMAIKQYDPYHHLVSTSAGTRKNTFDKYSTLSDFTNVHQYVWYPTVSESRYINDPSFEYNKGLQCENVDKPFFFGEVGYGPSVPLDTMSARDPYGFHIHNILWSTVFAGSMGPASYWWWKILSGWPSAWEYDYTNPLYTELYYHFKPVYTFTKNMPLLSESFHGKSNVSECNDKSGNIECLNNLQVYYMINSTQDTLYGWAQDMNFMFRSLFYNSSDYLMSCRKDDRPDPSSSSNVIELKMKKTPDIVDGVRYRMEWYDTETGERLIDIVTGEVVETYGIIVNKSDVECVLRFEFPKCIRDLDAKSKGIRNKYGDAVFVAYKDCDLTFWVRSALQPDPYLNVAGEIVCDQNTPQVFYKTTDDHINSIWWDPDALTWKRSNLNLEAKRVKGSLAVSHDGARVFFINKRNNINSIYYDYTAHRWYLDEMRNVTNKKAQGPITVTPNNQVFYRTMDNQLNNVWQDASGTWYRSDLNGVASSSVGNSLASNSQNEIFYVDANNNLKAIYYDYSSSTWKQKNLNNAAAGIVQGPIAIAPSGEVFFRTIDNKMGSINNNTGSWCRSDLNGSVTNFNSISMDNAKGALIQTDVTGKVFYINSNNNTDCIYNDNGRWVRFNVDGIKINADGPVHALASNVDGHVFCLAMDQNQNLVIQHYNYFPCALVASNSYWGQKKLMKEYDEPEEGMDAITLDENSGLKLYPNPTRGQFTIESENIMESVMLFNTVGNTLALFEPHDNTLKIDLSKYPSGMYFVRVVCSDGTISSLKIIKNNN